MKVISVVGNVLLVMCFSVVGAQLQFGPSYSSPQWLTGAQSNQASHLGLGAIQLENGFKPIIQQPQPESKEVKKDAPALSNYFVSADENVSTNVDISGGKQYSIGLPRPDSYPPLNIPTQQVVTLEKHIPVPVQVPVDKPYPVHIPKPYPVFIIKKVPYPVEKKVLFPIRFPLFRRFAVHVPVEKPVPYPVEKIVRYPVHIDRPVPYPVEKKVPVIVEKRVPVEKIVRVPVPYPIFVKYFPHEHKDEQNGVSSASYAPSSEESNYPQHQTNYEEEPQVRETPVEEPEQYNEQDPPIQKFEIPRYQTLESQQPDSSYEQPTEQFTYRSPADSSSLRSFHNLMYDEDGSQLDTQSREELQYEDNYDQYNDSELGRRHRKPEHQSYSFIRWGPQGFANTVRHRRAPHLFDQMYDS